MPTYRVSIPYIHQFTVEANNKEDAILKATSSGDGKIIDRDDSNIEVENIDHETMMSTQCPRCKSYRKWRSSVALHVNKVATRDYHCEECGLVYEKPVDCNNEDIIVK